MLTIIGQAVYSSVLYIAPRYRDVQRHCKGVFREVDPAGEGGHESGERGVACLGTWRVAAPLADASG